MKIRPSIISDIEPLGRVAQATGLFPGTALPDMMSGFLSGGEGHGIWLTYEAEGKSREVSGF
jgi:hypothetical protein